MNSLTAAPASAPIPEQLQYMKQNIHSSQVPLMASRPSRPSRRTSSRRKGSRRRTSKRRSSSKRKSSKRSHRRRNK